MASVVSLEIALLVAVDCTRLILHAQDVGLVVVSHVGTVLIKSRAAATVVSLILAVPAAAMEEFNLCGDKRNYC